MRVPHGETAAEPLLARLTDAERARAADKRVEEKRHEYITGQATLRTLLGRMLDLAPSEVAYRRGIKGKPYLAHALRNALDGDELHFNITHSGEVVVAAMARGIELGIDVEWHNERTDPQRVARRAFTERERADMARIPAAQRRQHFFQVWTCKEALVKCTGLGIHSGMADYEIALEGGCARVSDAWGRQRGVERLRVVPLPLGDEHAGALVHEPARVEVRRWLLGASPDPLAAI